MFQYMRKLEKTNPEKVKLLKAAGPNMSGNSGQGQQGPGDRYSHKNFQFSLHFCTCLSVDYEILDVLYVYISFYVIDFPETAEISFKIQF